MCSRCNILNTNDARACNTVTSHTVFRKCNNRNDNQKYYKYVCIATNQPDIKSKPNPNPNLNPTTKQHAIVSIQLNIVACPTYPAKFIRDNVVARFVLLSIVIVTLPGFSTCFTKFITNITMWTCT